MSSKGGKKLLKWYQESIFLREGNRYIRPCLADVLYIEGMKDYVSIYTSQRKIVCLQRLKGLEEQLPSSGFIRIHNSYIISIHKVNTINRHKVEIGEKSLPVGETYRQRFLPYLQHHKIKFSSQVICLLLCFLIALERDRDNLPVNFKSYLLIIC